MATDWQSIEDFERDMWEFSEFHVQEFERAPPKTIQDWRSRMDINRGASIFDQVQEADVTHFVSGRGRGHRNTILTPGAEIKSTENDDMDIKRKLRQVSGLGFSNELIERAIRTKTGAKSSTSSVEKCEGKYMLPEMKFILRPASEISQSSTSESESEGASSSSIESKTLPLTTMLKKRRNPKGKAVSTNVGLPLHKSNVTNSNNMNDKWIFKQPVREQHKTLQLESELEFPRL